jgi:hypothetical protein
MPRPPAHALGISRTLLRALTALNLIYGAAILALLVASLVAAGPVMGALGVPAGVSGDRLAGMRMIMVLGILAVPLGHVVLTRLAAIVDSVALGDPFVAENAERLTTIAWAVLAIEVLHLAVGLTARLVSSDDLALDIGWSPSVARWLAIVLCFVLARVFVHGTRMREDLEGTV